MHQRWPLCKSHFFPIRLIRRFVPFVFFPKPVTHFNRSALNLHVGVIVSRWAPQSSKLVAGCAEQAAVGSTPIHSRL